jgi:hypothetical protein
MSLLLLFFVYTCTELIPHCRIVWQLSLFIHSWEDLTEVRSKAAKRAWATKKAIADKWPLFGVYMVYTWYVHRISRYIPGISCMCVKHIFFVKFELLPCDPLLCACISGSCYFHAFNVYLPNINVAENGVCWYIQINNTMHIHSLYIGYTMKPRCVVLMDNYSFLKLSGFNIRLPWSWTLVYSFRIQINSRKLKFNILCIYHVHTMYIPALAIYMVYTWYIHGIYHV